MFLSFCDNPVTVVQTRSCVLCLELAGDLLKYTKHHHAPNSGIKEVRLQSDVLYESWEPIMGQRFVMKVLYL